MVGAGADYKNQFFTETFLVKLLFPLKKKTKPKFITIMRTIQSHQSIFRESSLDWFSGVRQSKALSEVSRGGTSRLRRGCARTHAIVTESYDADAPRPHSASPLTKSFDFRVVISVHDSFSCESGEGPLVMRPYFLHLYL